MIRFPNPGSDIMQMINIFKLLYANLSEFSSFDLNNMTFIMTNENVASSSGYIGADALEKSYQTTDTSRNPLYNQAKSYAEVYRLLGWIVSTENAALKFKFTYLGVHVAQSGASANDLFEESVLGINYPNQILSVKFENINKPFVTMLRTASKLGGIICRDEILIGPMNILNGYDDTQFFNIVKKIEELRKTKKYSNLNKELEKVAKEHNVSTNTLKNYTRFVISTLVYTGWMEKVKKKTYGSNVAFLQLTKKGLDLVNTIDKMYLLDGETLEEYDENIIRAVSRYSFIKMLQRAGFQVEDELSELIDEEAILIETFDSSEILFSPFQFFDNKKILKIFPEIDISRGEVANFEIQENSLEDYIYTSNKAIEAHKSIVSHKGLIIEKIKETYNENNNNIEKAVLEFMNQVNEMTQNDFYPFVGELFSIIFNLEVRVPQKGVNNERFDLIIKHETHSLPIEVKSPREEEMLSVKAIRQALENKVVLLSRYLEHYPTSYDMTSLSVGFNIPNSRSDVHKLIEDIYEVYHMNIGIVDIFSLINAAYLCVLEGKEFSIEEMVGMRGVIKFENL